jgi:hypothetical protein
MNTDELKALGKNEIPTISKHLDRTDVNFLIQTLYEKDDKVRYNAFLLLQSNSRELPFVYEHWSELENKLENANSYQRSIGHNAHCRKCEMGQRGQIHQDYQ